GRTLQRSGLFLKDCRTQKQGPEALGGHMKALVFLVAALALVVSLPASGNPAFEQQMNNFSHKNLICYAYFNLVAQCLGNNPKHSEGVKSYKKGAEHFFEVS